MAVTISQTEATVAIRASVTATEIDSAVAAVIGILFPAAATLVVHHAENAPDDIHNAALIRLLGWLYDADPSEPNLGRAMEVSGAMSLLAPWRVHRAGVLGGVAASPVPTPGAGLPPWPTTGRYILQVIDGELTWIEFPGP